MQTHADARPFSVALLIGLQVLLGVSALGPGASFILAPDGHLIQMPLSNLKNSPFSDFLIPGVILFVFLGIYPMAVAYSLWKQPAWQWPDLLNPFKRTHWAWAGSLAAGVILIIWITVEVQYMEIGLLHILYWVWGVALLLLTLLPNVHQYYDRNPRLV